MQDDMKNTNPIQTAERALERAREAVTAAESEVKQTERAANEAARAFDTATPDDAAAALIARERAWSAHENAKIACAASKDAVAAAQKGLEVARADDARARARARFAELEGTASNTTTRADVRTVAAQIVDFEGQLAALKTDARQRIEAQSRAVEERTALAAAAGLPAPDDEITPPGFAAAAIYVEREVRAGRKPDPNVLISLVAEGLYPNVNDRDYPAEEQIETLLSSTRAHQARLAKIEAQRSANARAWHAADEKRRAEQRLERARQSYTNRGLPLPPELAPVESIPPAERAELSA
jgi:hypothetical protein